MSSPDPVLVARARLGNVSRLNVGTAAEVAAARRDLAAAMLERHGREVAAATPLTDSQRARLAALLLGGEPR